MQELIVVPAGAANFVARARVYVPYHDTAKIRLALVRLEQCGGVARCDIARASRLIARRAGKTDEELGVLARTLPDEINPGVVVERIADGVARNGIAGWVVIELDKQRIELGLGDHVRHIGKVTSKGALGAPVIKNLSEPPKF